MKIYEINYGDGECNNALARFSTRPRAEKYLKYFKGIDEESWDGYLPEIDEIEVDDCDRPYFARAIDIDENGKVEQFGNNVELTSKRAHARLLFEPEIRLFYKCLTYTTATINKEDAENEALAAWMVAIIDGRWIFESPDFAHNSDVDELWMASHFGI